MENKFVISGKVDTIFPGEIKGNFEKRLFWITENIPNRPQTWQLEMRGNDGEALDNFKPGQQVECNVEIKGFKWKKDGKESVFNTLHCTMIKLKKT